MKCLVFLVASAAAFGAADPQLVGLMMPEAKIMAGFQVSETQSTPFGQFLMKQIPANAGLDNFVAATGFDPRQDLNEIVAASPGGTQWLIAGRGAFQATRTAGLAELAGAKITNYKGVDVITGGSNAAQANRGNRAPRPNGGADAAALPVNGLAFLDSSTVLIGDITTIKAAIDRRGTGTIFNGPLALKAHDVSSRNQAWAAIAGGLQDFVPALANGAAPGGVPAPPMANLFQAITGLSVGVNLTSTNVTLTSEAATRSSQDAQSLVDVIHFMLSIAQANRKDAQGANAAALADATTVNASGASVKLTLTVPEKQLEQLFQPQPKKVAQAVH